MSTKAVLVRKSRWTFETHKPKAPSGRELPTKSGEGERVTIELVQIQSCAGSFRHASRATFLPEEGYVAARQYRKGVRTKSSVLLFVLRQVNLLYGRHTFRCPFCLAEMERCTSCTQHCSARFSVVRVSLRQARFLFL